MNAHEQADVVLLLADDGGRRVLAALTQPGAVARTAIWTSRLVPQQTAQICWPSAGQPRRARRSPQRGHTTDDSSLSRMHRRELP